jgi:hypothetical protein
MRLRAVIYVALLAIPLGCALLVGAVLAAPRLPPLLQHFTKVLDLEIGTRALPLLPAPSGAVSDRGFTRLGTGGVTLLASSVTSKNFLGLVLRGEIDTLVLQDLKLAFRIERTAEGPIDLSFLESLPRTRLLEVRNAEILLTLDGAQAQVRLIGLHATIRDFSPETGGTIRFEARYAMTRNGRAEISASGTFRGDVRLAGVSPRPHGIGTVSLVVDTGKIAHGDRSLSLGGLTLEADLAYDQETERVAIESLRVASKEFGEVRGTAEAVLRDAMPWSASLSAASIDLARALAALGPHLPERYRAWTAQGQGAIEARARGTFGSDPPSADGTVTVSLVGGGFGSPDGTKAAQGVNAALTLEMKSAAPERKLAFRIRVEQRDGEFLWGTYYNNLAGRRASLTTDGTAAWDGSPRFELDGTLDLFRTGAYAFEGGGTASDWGIQVKAADVSHARFVDTFAREYLKGVSPRLANLSVGGASSLEATVRHAGGAVTVSGTYRTNGTSLSAPELQFAIGEIAAHVPFELAYPPSAQAPPPREPGVVILRAIQRRRLVVENLRIPLVVSRNRLDVSEPIVIPQFGGTVHLYGLQVDDVLFPSRYRFGVKIIDVDLGRMTRRLTGVEYPGSVNADLGMMRYENNRIESEGRAVIAVFGGEVEATDLFAENIASVSRRMGGNIAFRNISLEELTRKIAIGKMTGIVQGSLRDFVLEYGEPASFVLELESVERRGVAQSISMDAIQSISVLGTGADSALSRGVTQFFREYPYSKIGLRCVLKNDQFAVNGTIHDRGKEYLVRRGLLRGVDVVNQNPQNVISFRDMAERVKRLSRPPQVEPGGITVE